MAESNEIIDEPSVPVTPLEKPKSRSWSGFAAGFFVAALGVVLLFKFAGSPFDSPKYVVVDSSAIVSQLLANFTKDPNQPTDSATALKSAAAVSVKLHDALQVFANKGEIVINQKALLAYPPSLDKTNEVAAAIGVSMPQTQK